MKFSITYFISAILVLLFGVQIQAQTYTLKFKTNQGKFSVMLYDFTPNHRDLILTEIKKGTYKNAQFNRVIKDFVIQGGELDDSILLKEAKNPNVKPIRLNPEFHPKAFHKIGALGAGRDDNSSKGSYFNQIYFVVGKKINPIDLELFEKKKGIKYTSQQREEYLKNGGLPRLDNDYTVFGEVVEGLDHVLKISQKATDKNDVPIEPIIFDIKIKKNLPKKIKKTTISASVGLGHR
ncbi:peptidylprolyl isomerase [Faecalibacter bovis]|uniref:peptidylprolyl isomerase n=1 Tax=Faecalibacter bovis TaxID=2898187 RepID=A0ABX7XCF5_9FLAO|nr:peptidylprolyl isomerase [Faecalibacter bovis]QTV05591.1 peptidylprolyl isomerase [Faecalibacter bovis]